MSKKQSIALCGLFVLFILVCAVLNLCWPDREFSPMENRTLAQRPDFSWKGLFRRVDPGLRDLPHRPIPPAGHLGGPEIHLRAGHAQAGKQRHLFCRRSADCPV